MDTCLSHRIFPCIHQRNNVNIPKFHVDFNTIEGGIRSTQNSDDTEEKSALEVDSLYEGTPSQLDIEGDKKKKSVVLQLLSQLKLGVDMTRVGLPL